MGSACRSRERNCSHSNEQRCKLIRWRKQAANEGNIRCHFTQELRLGFYWRERRGLSETRWKQLIQVSARADYVGFCIVDRPLASDRYSMYEHLFANKFSRLTAQQVEEAIENPDSDRPCLYLSIWYLPQGLLVAT